MSNETVHRRLAAILAADVVGYSKLMGADEVGTLARLKSHRRELVDPMIVAHHGRIVKTTGDGALVEFGSVVDAVACAVAIQRGMVKRSVDLPEGQRIVFRIGINVGDIIIDGDDIFGDGVNIAARLETLCEPGGVCISRAANDQIRDKLSLAFADMGEQTVKNISRTVGVFGLRSSDIEALPESNLETARSEVRVAGEQVQLTLPSKPSIAVLPFANLSADAEQEYFADGVVEDIITALPRVKSFFIIARNSTFAYKGRSIDMRQVGRELGVRYVLEGSIRRAGNRVRITGQLIDASTGAHLWADRFEGALDDIFGLQDEITGNVVGAIAPKLGKPR
jgi:TolB-like protein/class 3 adenylate cyclase